VIERLVDRGEGRGGGPAAARPQIGAQGGHQGAEVLGDLGLVDEAPLDEEAPLAR
jgi:hypothetical protein